MQITGPDAKALAHALVDMPYGRDPRLPRVPPTPTGTELAQWLVAYAEVVNEAAGRARANEMRLNALERDIEAVQRIFGTRAL